MKLVRFEHGGVVFNGRLEGGNVLSPKGVFSRDEVRLLAPCDPSKIVCVGLNYPDHADELDMSVPGEEPVIFLKPPSSVIGHGENIICPAGSDCVDFEAELAVVMGEKAAFVSPREAGRYILGYTCFNDVTARDLQKKDGQWTRAKSFDTFAPIGPCVETDLDTADVRLKAFRNGRIRQDSHTSFMLFDVPQLVSFISGVMTLLPGDVIATGTPPGTGHVFPGDDISVEIEGIGVLQNRVTVAR